MNEIHNGLDIIDSRDVHDRLEELREASEFGDIALDEEEELAILEDFWAEILGATPDAYHGATLIHEDYFETFARDLAEDIGALDRSESWPYMHIDWKAAAGHLAMDYTPVEFDGITYYTR